jgi:hypothetical protein
LAVEPDASRQTNGEEQLCRWLPFGMHKAIIEHMLLPGYSDYQ